MENKEQQPQQPDVGQKMDEMLQQPAESAQATTPMQPMNGAANGTTSGAKVKKKKNVPAIVLSVLAILAIGVGVFFGIQYFGEKERADKLAQQDTTTVATTESAEETKSEEEKTTNTEVSYGFDASKIKNGVNGTEYSLIDVKFMGNGVGVSLSKDQRQVKVSLNERFLNEQGYNVSDAKAYKELAEEFKAKL